MVHDDYMTEGKQKVTAEFYKHIQTHARKGQPQVDIAFIQGRYEAPFTAISGCNANIKNLYDDEDRRIWGKNGSPEEEWGRGTGVTGKELEHRLDAVNITANKNAIPNDPEKPFVTSGIRVGTPAATSRGLKTEDFTKIGEFISMAIYDFDNKADVIKQGVADICAKYPLYK